MPPEIRAEVTKACKRQELDADQTIAEIADLVSDDVYLDYAVWSGPGFDDPDLLIDVWVVGRAGLYVYSARPDNEGTAQVFWEDFTVLSLVHFKNQEQSPFVLFLGGGANLDTGKVYGTLDDRDRLMRFRRNVTEARAQYYKQRR